MALDDTEQEYAGEDLSSLAVIESYLRSPDFMKDGPMEQWNVLSAIQREIDLRYAVTPDRHVSCFIDVASYKGQIQIEALREIQREIYELAPNFIDMRQPYAQTYFNLFPQYFSPSAMNEDETYSIEQLFQKGTTPLEQKSGQKATVAQYRDFLANVCYWLKNFRYVNACPYTFTLSTYSRDWSWKNDSDELCSDYQPLSDCYDIWQYDCPQHERGARKKDWDLSNDISASSNGTPYNGIQVEVFQWFRTANVNPVDFTDPRNPIGMDNFNGFPAIDTGPIADLMPHRDSGWTPLSASEVDALTAAWTQYEWELEDPSVQPRHIPYDIGDWRCYSKLSVVTDWSVLEYAFDPNLSSQWAAKLSAGWDSVMTNQQVADWGTIYLSAFPNRGMTGKIIGMPVLSGTPAKSEGFFDESGHLMTYRIDLRRWSDIWQRWVDKSAGEAETKLTATDMMTMHKEHIPLSATIENPFALSADACYVIYSTGLPDSYHYQRDVEQFEIHYPSYPTDGLRMDVVTVQNETNNNVYYHSTQHWQSAGNRAIYYYNTYDEYQHETSDSSGNHTIHKENRYLLDRSKSLVLVDEELSTAGWGSGWHILDEIANYADSFGLITGEPIEDLSSELSDDLPMPDWYPIDSDPTAHVFMRVFPISAYSYETLFYKEPTQIPPVDFDMLNYFEEKAPDGPWYDGGDWGGIGNEVELEVNSNMRLFTFFDFSDAFGLRKEDL